MSCAGVGHDRLGKYRDRALQCIICTRDHKATDYIYRVNGYNMKKDKICAYVIPKCANCGENHQAISFKYPAQLKAQTQT